MRKFNEEIILVAALVEQHGFGAGVATLIGEQLASYLGRCSANAVVANKSGREATLGRPDKDGAATLRLAAMKVAKVNAGYLPCRLLLIADATSRFAASGVSNVRFDLPEAVVSILKGMEADGLLREAQAAAVVLERRATEDALKARAELVEKLLLEHDAKRVSGAKALEAKIAVKA